MLLISLGSWRSPFLVNVTAQERVRVADLNNHLIDPFDEARAGKAVVFLFVSVDCPISNRYAPETRRLEERFAPEGVAFWLVYPNASDTPAAIRRHMSAYGFPGRALRDLKHDLIKHAGATITPEAVVSDSRRQLAYRGRIDDRFVNLGLERPHATRRDLAEALTAVLAGKSVPQASAPAIGCYIADFAHPSMKPIGIALVVAAMLVGTGAVAQRARLEADEPGVTFNSHVAPILFTHCAGCHRPGGVAPFSVLTYNAARQHARQIGVATESRYMPPWKSEAGLDKFIGQQQLTDDEIEIIRRWIAAGAPEGDPKQRPPLPRSNGVWQLGKPDLVVRTREAYTLKAEGADTFRLFVLPIPVDQSRFIAGVEFRPDNPRVVHHANILIDPTPQSRERNAQDAALGEQGLLPGSARYPEGHFLGWTPGQPDPLLPKGLAWRLDPGTDLVVQLHMQPSGKPEPIRFSVGLFFSAAPPERTPVMLRLGGQDIDIPAGERTYTTADSYVLPVDVEVLAIKPHAHFRARDVKGWATLPDGTRRSLIHIPDWDFRWQNVYRFETAPLLTKGTILRMVHLRQFGGQPTQSSTATSARSLGSQIER